MHVQTSIKTVNIVRVNSRSVFEILKAQISFYVPLITRRRKHSCIVIVYFTMDFRLDSIVVECCSTNQQLPRLTPTHCAVECGAKATDATVPLIVFDISSRVVMLQSWRVASICFFLSVFVFRLSTYLNYAFTRCGVFAGNSV